MINVSCGPTLSSAGLHNADICAHADSLFKLFPTFFFFEKQLKFSENLEMIHVFYFLFLNRTYMQL